MHKSIATSPKYYQMKKDQTPLLVTTIHKGVFFGYGNPDINETKTIKLTNARMCVYWSSDVKGVLGLAATGPSKSSRVTASVPSLTATDVTSVSEVTAEAVKQWEAQPWS